MEIGDLGIKACREARGALEFLPRIRDLLSEEFPMYYASFVAAVNEIRIYVQTSDRTVWLALTGPQTFDSLVNAMIAVNFPPHPADNGWGIGLIQSLVTASNGGVRVRINLTTD